ELAPGNEQGGQDEEIAEDRQRQGDDEERTEHGHLRQFGPDEDGGAGAEDDRGGNDGAADAQERVLDRVLVAALFLAAAVKIVRKEVDRVVHRDAEGDGERDDGRQLQSGAGEIEPRLGAQYREEIGNGGGEGDAERLEGKADQPEIDQHAEREIELEAAHDIVGGEGGEDTEAAQFGIADTGGVEFGFDALDEILEQIAFDDGGHEAGDKGL